MSEVTELQEQVVDAAVDATEASPAASPATDERQSDQSDVMDFNLDEHPQFREWKRKMDQQLDQSSRQYQQQLAHLQQQLEERDMSEMDDFQREQHQRKRLEQQMQYMSQELETQKAQAAKYQVLSEISAETSVPMNMLMNANDVSDAWRMAYHYQRQQEQQRSQQATVQAQQAAMAKQQRVEANRPDLGQGAASTPYSEWEQRLNKAQTAVDVAKLWFPEE